MICIKKNIKSRDYICYNTTSSSALHILLHLLTHHICNSVYRCFFFFSLHYFSKISAIFNFWKLKYKAYKYMNQKQYHYYIRVCIYLCKNREYIKTFLKIIRQYAIMQKRLVTVKSDKCLLIQQTRVQKSESRKFRVTYYCENRIFISRQPRI